MQTPREGQNLKCNLIKFLKVREKLRVRDVKWFLKSSRPRFETLVPFTKFITSSGVNS